MKSNTPEEIIVEITHSKEVVSTVNELVSSRRKVLNKYMIAPSVIALIVLFTYFFLSAEQLSQLQLALQKDNHLFYWMLLVGFSAEVVAGSMGMGYGVICTTILLVLNVSPPVISASIHSAESFTSAAGSISHWQLGNINKKLVKSLAIPAIIGAVIGAILLTYVGESKAKSPPSPRLVARITSNWYFATTTIKSAQKIKLSTPITKGRSALPWWAIVSVSA